MDKKIVKFNDTETKKHKFIPSPILINNTDINNSSSF